MPAWEKDNVPWDQISDKPAGLDDVGAEISAIQAQLGEVANDVNDIESQVANLEAQVAGLSNEVNTGTVIASGGVRVGQVTTSANSSNAGMLRYDALNGTMQYSNGSSWVNL